MKKIELLATIPDTLSSIKMGATAARVTFEIPENQLPAFLNLVAYGRNKVLKLTVEGGDSNVSDVRGSETSDGVASQAKA